MLIQYCKCCLNHNTAYNPYKKTEAIRSKSESLNDYGLCRVCEYEKKRSKKKLISKID